MYYVEAFEREQMMITWNLMVEPNSTVGLIDIFVNSLHPVDYGIKEMTSEGMAYEPKSFLKLYIYRSDNGIRSSRKITKGCKVNVGFRWMLGGVEFDFRIISDFRKDNIDNIKKIVNEFNKGFSRAGDWECISINGSKYSACNSKDNKFAKNKLDDRNK